MQLKNFYYFGHQKKNIYSLPSNTIKALDQKLILLSQYIPDNFQRTSNKNSRCHPFGDVNRWKATELRQCLLYTGFVIFQDILSNQIYTHFKELSIALRILLTVNINEEYIDYASNLIRHFVESFRDIYGTSSISHNIHALIHLPDDYKKYGSLENISAFPFESFMQPIKKKN